MQSKDDSQRAVALSWILNRIAGCLAGIIDTGTLLIASRTEDLPQRFLEWRAEVFRALPIAAEQALAPQGGRESSEVLIKSIRAEFDILSTALLSLTRRAAPSHAEIDEQCRLVSKSYFEIVRQITQLADLQRLPSPYHEFIDAPRQEYYASIVKNIGSTIADCLRL